MFQSDIYTQKIQRIISSPFLRCLQTAQEMSQVLNLPGLHTCNSIVDIVSDCCGMHQQPLVPASNVEELGINIASRDTTELPKYPENEDNAIKR